MQAASLFVVGGGGIFQEHHRFTIPDLYHYPAGSISEYAQICFMARQFDLPSVLLCQGVGPLHSAGARDIVREVFDNSTYASVRDAGSARLLNDIGVSRDVIVAPDLVWTLPVQLQCQKSDRHADARQLAVILRDWPFNDTWLQNVTGALITVVELGWRLKFLNFGGPADSVNLEWIRSRLPTSTSCSFVEVFRDPRSAPNHFVDCSAVLAMRMHSVIVALKCGLPTAVIEYDSKVGAVADQAMLPESRRISIDADETRFIKAVRHLCEQANSSSASSDQSAITKLIAAAQQHQILLERAVHASDGRPTRNVWRATSVDWINLWNTDRRFLIAENDTSKNKISKLQGELDVLNKQTQLLIAESKSDKNTVSKLQGTLDVLNKETQLLIAESKSDKNTISKLQGKLDVLNKETQLLIAESKSNKNTITDLQGKLEVLNSELDQARTQNKDWGRMTMDLREKLDLAEIDNNNLLQSVSNSRELNHRLEERIRSFENSTSWKLTRPLRSVRLAAHRILRRFYTQRSLIAHFVRKAVDGLIEREASPLPRNAVPDRLDLSREVKHQEVTAALSAVFQRVKSEGRIGLMVINSALEFDLSENQRPINLAREAAQLGFHVILVAWQWDPAEPLRNRLRVFEEGVTEIARFDFADLLAFHSELKELACEKLYVVTLPSRDFVHAHSQLRGSGFRIIYDVMDDWKEFSKIGQAPWFEEMEERHLILNADVISAVSPRLFELIKQERDDVVLVPNGYRLGKIGHLPHPRTKRIQRTQRALDISDT